MDRSFDRNDKTIHEADVFAHGESPETIKVYKAKTIQEKLDIRFNGPRDNIAIVAKENLLSLPFKGVPHPDYPSPWLTVNFGEYGDLVKATAYVLKKKFDLPPFARVALVSSSVPHYQLICLALWYLRCTVVSISPKLGNDVKQFWVRTLDIRMMFYDKNLVIYDEEKQKPLDEGGEWIWPWEYPLHEDELNLSAGTRGILMLSVYQKDFCEEILQAKLEGKSYKREGKEEDIILINGTSSSTQAIIKNGQCSKMKFVPFTAHTYTTPFLNRLFHYNKPYLKAFSNIPFYFTMGNSWINTSTITNGGPIIYHTQQLYDIGFVPENLLDDLMETNPDGVLLFPFNYAEIKKLFDDNHPRCPIWRKFISSRENFYFRVSGAPLSESLAKWFREELDTVIIDSYGSSEAGLLMWKDVLAESVPGEEGYLSRIPWHDFYLEPLDKKNPNIGELYVHSSLLMPGYARKAEKGEFYDSPIPGIRIDVETDKLFTMIDGFRFYKTNDIWIRSLKTGKYKYVSRADDVLAFATGLKMNPLPFEEAITEDCNNVKYCCLLLDDTQNEVVCFIEPVWSNIIMEDGKPFDDTIDPESLSKEEKLHLRKIAQKQTWDSIYSDLENSPKSLNIWTKQLTINNIVVVDYGKKFPVTGKGSLARRVARLEYSHVLKKISKLIRGEITEIEEDDKEKKNVNEEEIPSTPETKVEVEKKEEDSTSEKDTESTVTKTQEEEFDDEIQKAVMIIYESIKEIIPSTPDLEEFNINSPFAMYSIDSLATKKLTNVLSRKYNKPFSPSTLFNYGTTIDLAKYITGNSDKLKESIPKSLEEKKISEKVAVIGMALRLPGAINNAKTFWMSLAKGRDCVMPPVMDRKLHLGYVDKPSHLLGKNEHNIPKCGCYDNRPNVAKPSEFDAEFFNCLPEEVTNMDPRQRWVLETSWEALENSGIAPNTLENTVTGVFVGCNDDHEYQDIFKENDLEISIGSHSTPSGIVGRLSYFYKLFGPSLTVDTACSTGASALHTACRSLQFGDCDLSIVSGVKYMYSSENFHKSSVARMTSPNGRCATFDKDADGFAPSEGCVTFILKRYEDAVRDKDNILSVILGSSMGQSGLRQSISAPSSDGQALNLKRALEIAGVDPSEVSFVETHGTGTPLGDAIEVDALNKVYAGTHTKENPLVIGSVKTNIGHTNEAAGLASMAKVILAMQHKYIPKNIHFNTLNPEIDIQSIPLQIATKNIPWENHSEKPRIAQVSSFGLQGSIVHIILQEYVPENGEEIEKSKDSKEDHILTISAKTPAALNELCESYLNVLEGMEDNEENIENLCYTSNVGRQHFNYRISAIGKNADELYNDLEEKMEVFGEGDESINNNVTSNGRGISQQLEIYSENASTDLSIPDKVYDIVKELLSTENIFKKAFEFCDSEIQKIVEGVSLKQMVEEKNGKESKLNNLFFILSFYYSLQELIESIMIKENSRKVIYGGFGFGEIISLVISGGLSFSSAISLIQTDIESDNNDLSSWYEKQSISKFQKTVFIPSLEKEFKNGEKLSLEDISTIVKNKNEMKNDSSFVDKYIQKSKIMTLYSINDDQEIVSKCPSSLNVIKFFDDSTKKNLFDQFIMNQYNNGQNIDWKEVNNRLEVETQKPCPVHKIELPNYPFQRSTYWPIPLKN